MKMHLPALRTGALALSLFCAAPMAQADTIVETAVNAGRFQTLAKALQVAGLVETLQSEGPFTVFAPTDDAFAQLPHGVVEELLKKRSRAQLTNTLTFHVASGRLNAADVLGRPYLSMLNRQRAGISVDDSGARIAGANISVTDIQCDNGVIHVIDSVLIPEGNNLVGVAQQAGQFQTLIAAAQAAGLAEALTGPGPFTVFAPNDEAFAKLGKDTISTLLKPENRDQLARILKYHVVPARAYADDALRLTKATTLADAEVNFRIAGGRLQVGNATVLANDIEATNGVIHVIDQVLMPPAAVPQGRKVIGVYVDEPGEALAAQLGLDPNQALVVTRLTKNGTAAKAGLQRFDVIAAIGDHAASRKSLADAKEQAGFGGTLALTVLRGGKRLHIDVEVGIERH